MNFPETVFGICPNCGGKAADYDVSDETLTSADKVRGSLGSGIKLVRFRGDFICEMCKNNIINREETEKEAELDQSDQDFRGDVGFKKSVPADEHITSYDP